MGMVEKLFDICQSSSDKDKWKRYMSDTEVKKNSGILYHAMEGLGTDEEAVYGVFKSFKSPGDFCAVGEKYENTFGESLLEALNGDFDYGWEGIAEPLVDMTKKYAQTESEEYCKDHVEECAENLKKYCKKIPNDPKCNVLQSEDLLVKAKKCGHKSVEDYKNSDWKCDSGSAGGGGSEEQSDNWNMYMCVIEHPDAKGEKFADGKRTRFRIGTDYYMGNGKKIRKGVELDYSCDDKEFRGISFADKDDETPNRGTKRPVDAEVMDIQKFLTDEGYDISTDGRIGSETSGAILDYIVDNNSDEFKPSSVLELQKKINSCYSMNIKEDGKAGPKTLDAIADALESAQDGNLCK
jgi:hypothetical protein